MEDILVIIIFLFLNSDWPQPWFGKGELENLHHFSHLVELMIVGKKWNISKFSKRKIRTSLFNMMFFKILLYITIAEYVITSYQNQIDKK